MENGNIKKCNINIVQYEKKMRKKFNRNRKGLQQSGSYLYEYFQTFF